MSEQPDPVVTRRDVLTTAAALAAAGGVSGGVEAESADRAEPGAVELPSWRVGQSHEVVRAKSNYVVTKRSRLYTSTGITHINTTTPDADDIAIDVCDVGGSDSLVRHRFTAVTFAAGTGQSYEGGDDPYSSTRIEGTPPVRDMTLDVSHNDDRCGNTAFSVNNFYQGTMPLSAMTGKRTHDSTTAVNLPTSSEIDGAARRFLRKKPASALHMPDDKNSLASWLKNAIGILDYGVDSAKLAASLSVLGVGIQGLSMLKTMAKQAQYDKTHNFDNHGARFAQENITSRGDGVAMIAIDFTVTVPPDTATSVDIHREFEPRPFVEPTGSALYNGEDPSEHLSMNDSYSLRVPSIENVQELRRTLPTIPSLEDPSLPDPEITIDGPGDSGEGESSYGPRDELTFAAGVNGDASDLSFGWRIYKDEEPVRPAVYYGREYTRDFREPWSGESAFGSGYYVAELTVTDTNTGYSATTSKRFTIGVDNELPTATFTADPDPATVGETVVFNGRESSDAETNDLHYQWEFGDGTTEGGHRGPSRGDSDSLSHSYEEPGTYKVTLTVTDDAGGKAKHSKEVEVVDGSRPTPEFSLKPESPSVGERVIFDGRDSSDPEGGDLSFAWEFGDGTGAGGFRGPARGDSDVQYHTYVAAGTYDVTLTVTDDDGLEATTTEKLPVGGGGGDRGDPDEKTTKSGEIDAPGDSREHTYTPETPDPGTLKLEIVDYPEGSDFDLFVTLDGRKPSRASYDLRSTGKGSNEKISIDSGQLSAATDVRLLVSARDGAGSYELEIKEWTE